MPHAPPPATAANANAHTMPGDTTHPSHDIVMGDDQSAFTFSFPPTGPPASAPTVRRAPPAAIPNFPNATEHRSPPPAVPFSPSPTHSPMSHSPFHSPEQAGRPLARQYNIHQPFATPANEPPSPWQTLAASSGAPTPSIEGGPLGRSSPHLGYPFERLNIGNSWSGTNLFEEPARSTRDPEPSLGDSGFFDPAALSAERRKTSLPIKLPTSLAPPHSTKSPSPLATNVGQSGIKAQMISVADLAKVLPRSTTLVLDVRPPSSFRASHIPNSHSITIPSTLLRRSGFDISKLVQMLSPESSRDVFHWREKSDIVLLDADSSSLSAGGVLDGLASKFTREGYTKGLWVVKGGHAAIKSSGAIPLVSDERDEASRHREGAGPQRGSMAGGLTSAAFMQESTAGGVKSRRQPPPKGLTIPATPAFNLTSSPFGALSMDTAATERPTNRTPSMTIPGFDNARPSAAKLQPANPFFDNIRQNLELSHGGITERIPLNLPASVRQNADKFPAWLRELVTMDEKESQEQLAQEFYNLELHEQRRLQAVMEWHTKGSGGVLQYGEGSAPHQPEGKREKASWERAVQDQCDMSELQRLVNWETGKVEHEYFPFSITAGVERGTKNRYKNIWPYDFSRVRLESPPDQDSDYINASFVQPRGTARRYIATQGPLDATYRDFWTLVWEQNVRVIVMITKQFEGGLIKCGNYWDQRQYGHLKLEKVKQTGGEDKGQPSAAAGFDFGPAAATPVSSQFPKGDEANITRTFLLSRTDKPEEPPRKVVQIQCVGWPDFDVPEEPETLLRLVNDVNLAAEQVKPEGCERKSEQPPVLVHCSAGVGRTGSFIVVDAVLDGLQREIHEEKSRKRSQSLIEEASQPEAIPPHHANSAPAASSGSQTPANGAPDSHLLSVSPVKRTLSGTPVTPPFTSSPGTLPAGDDGAAVSNLNLPAQQEKGMEGMDLDAAKASFKDERSAFSKYRGSSVASVSSDNDTRRPSLSSIYTQSERLSDESIQQRVGRPKPVIGSDRRHRSPSPISRLNHPVSSVLEGMRVQRMSLVQTLRQYLFVHRAIIYHYLNMLEDEETSSDIARPESVPLQGTQGNKKGSSGSSGSAGSLQTLGSGSGSLASTTGSVGSGLLSSAGVPSMTTGSASGSTDDESHAKRRASPTEIHPDSVLGNGAPGLTKRPSFKKMRPAVESLASTAAGGTGRLGKARTWMGTGESALEEKSPEEEKEIKR